MSSNVFVSLSSFCGILSLILSIYASTSTVKLKKNFKKTLLANEYDSSIERYKNNLKGYQASILNDEIKTNLIINDLLYIITEYSHQFELILSIKDKFQIYRFKKYLQTDIQNINFDKICNYISLITGTMTKKGGLL